MHHAAAETTVIVDVIELERLSLTTQNEEFVGMKEEYCHYAAIGISLEDDMLHSS